MADKPNVQAAIDQLKNMQRVFRAFEDAENVLAVLANADSVAQSAKAEAAAAARARDDAHAAGEELRAANERAKSELAAAIGDAREQARAIVAAAELKAEQIVGAAITARDDAAGRLVKLNEQIGAAESAVAELEARRRALQATVERAERIAAAAA